MDNIIVRNVEKDELELVFPTLEYKKQVEEYLQEFIDNGEYEIAGDGGLDRIKDYDEWLKKIQNDLLDKNLDDCRVQSTVYLTVRKSDNKVVGNLQIRHRLNEKIFNYGGHIGDSIRPLERKKGYATEQIRLALEKCKELGIGNVLIECNKDNEGSRKSIINNGGILEKEVYINNELIQRYWISLKKRYANRHIRGKKNCNTIYVQKHIENDIFNGDVCYYNFKDIDKKISTPKGKAIIDENYEMLEFYDYTSKVKLSAFYDDKGENIEWYFDIARKIGKENDVPYEDDLYLDVVVTPDKKIILLDEDELDAAYNRLEISKSEYDMAHAEANKLITKLKGNEDELKLFTDSILKVMQNAN